MPPGTTSMRLSAGMDTNIQTSATTNAILKYRMPDHMKWARSICQENRCSTGGVPLALSPFISSVTASAANVIRK